MRTTRLVSTPALLAAGVTVALVATATPADAVGAVPTPVAHAPGAEQRPAADAQSSVAGYVASLDGTARRTVVGTFTVPTVTCPARDPSPLFIGLGLFGTTAGPSTEFDYATADLTVTCTQGVAFYEAAVTAFPDRQTGAVSPGDVLQVRVTTAFAKSTVTITDQTSGGVFRVQGGGVEPTGVQASVQGGFEGQRFPRFGLVRFQGIKVDGNALGTLSPTSFDQATPGGKLLLQTTPLVSDRSFTVRFRAQP